MHIYKEELQNISIEMYFSLNDYETRHFSSDPIIKDLLPGYMARKEPYGFLVQNIKGNDLIVVCNKESSREYTKCHANVPEDDSFSCRFFRHSTHPDGYMMACFKGNYTISIISMTNLKVACKAMWDQANHFSKKYLDNSFPSCEDLNEFKREGQTS